MYFCSTGSPSSRPSARLAVVLSSISNKVMVPQFAIEKKGLLAKVNATVVEVEEVLNWSKCQKENNEIK